MIFTKLWATEFQHHSMSFSGTTIIKIVTEKTLHELFAWNFDTWSLINSPGTVCISSHFYLQLLLSYYFPSIFFFIVSLRHGKLVDVEGRY